jgi:hypothetical protein
LVEFVETPQAIPDGAIALNQPMSGYIARHVDDPRTFLLTAPA